MNERHVSFRQDREGRLAWWIGGGVVAVAIAAGYFYYTHKAPDAPAAEPVATLPAPTAAEANAETGVLYPVPAQESQQALPTLAESDDTAFGALADIIGSPPADQLLERDGIIKRIVVSVDNLSLDRLAVERRPVKSTPGSLVVEERGEVVTLSADQLPATRHSSTSCAPPIPRSWRRPTSGSIHCSSRLTRNWGTTESTSMIAQ